MDLPAAFAVASRGQRELATRKQLEGVGIGRGRLARAVAAGELVRVQRAVYGRAPLPPRPEHLLGQDGVDRAFLRHVQAALLAAGPSSAACGRTAAVLWGLDLLVEPDEVDLAVSRTGGRVQLPGVRLHRRTRLVTASVGGLRACSPTAVLRECAQDLPLRESVAVFDSALRARRVRAGQLTAARGTSLHRTLQLVDPRSGSVLESALRVLLVQAGLAPPQSQFVIRGGGAFLARVDFCWPAQRLVVEADGRRWHDPQDRRNADRLRANACASYGWRVLRFTWAEVLHDPEYVVSVVRMALARAA